MRNTVYTTSTISVRRHRSVSQGMAKVWKAPIPHSRVLFTNDDGETYEVCVSTCLCKRLPLLG